MTPDRDDRRQPAGRRTIHHLPRHSASPPLSACHRLRPPCGPACLRPPPPPPGQLVLPASSPHPANSNGTLAGQTHSLELSRVLRRTAGPGVLLQYVQAAALLCYLSRNVLISEKPQNKKERKTMVSIVVILLPSMVVCDTWQFFIEMTMRLISSREFSCSLRLIEKIEHGHPSAVTNLQEKPRGSKTSNSARFTSSPAPC